MMLSEEPGIHSLQICSVLSPHPSFPPCGGCLLCLMVFFQFFPLDEIPLVGIRVPHKCFSWLCPCE